MRWCYDGDDDEDCSNGGDSDGGDDGDDDDRCDGDDGQSDKQKDGQTDRQTGDGLGEGHEEIFAVRDANRSDKLGGPVTKRMI